MNSVEWVALIVFPDMRFGWLDTQKIISLEVMWGRVENFFLLLRISSSLSENFIPRTRPSFLSLMKKEKGIEG